MTTSLRNMEDEYHLSVKWVSLALVALATVLVYVGDTRFESWVRLRVLHFAILLLFVSALAWRLESTRPIASRWFTVLALTALLYAAIGWLRIPESLVGITVLVTLATALLGLHAAMFTTLLQTVYLLWLWRTGLVGVQTVAWISLSLLALWSTLGILWTIYRRWYRVSHWVWQSSQEIHRLLEENRDQTAGLKQSQHELVTANRTLTLLNERLAAMRLVAEEAEKAKAAFVAKISHEFRTPLNMIIGLIDSLADAPTVYGQALPAALLDDLEIVRRNSEHLTSMINDVLALSQAEAGHLILHREWVDLGEDITNAVTVVRPLLEKKNLAIKVNLQPELPRVYCDRTRIRQVILNLVSNAARFTQTGGITVKATCQAQHLVVSVTDTGPGIVAEDAERIFEPFQQSTGGFWRDQGGSGLGLSISRQFIQRHDGQIWLESELGVGSTFSFRLPVDQPLPPHSGPQRWMSDGWSFHERIQWPKVPHLPNQPRAILCDESGFFYSLFRPYASELEFVEVNNLAQVCNELQRCPAHLVIFNASSPTHLGPLLAQAREQIADTPLIGCYVPPPIDRALAAGAMDYLIKPVTQSDLQEALQALGEPIQHLLIVDDEPDIRSLYSRMLHQYDDKLEIATVADGAEALCYLHEHRPDVVLLDVVMSKMDGWQFLERKNQDAALKQIPVIIISAEDLVAQVIKSDMLVATAGQGVTINQLLRASLHFSKLILDPIRELDLAPG